MIYAACGAESQVEKLSKVIETQTDIQNLLQSQKPTHKSTVISRKRFEFNSAMKWTTIFLSWILFSAFTNADFEGRDVHAEMIKEGLSSIVCPENIDVVINGSKNLDKKVNDAEGEPQRHFETRDLNRSYDYVKREQQRVLDYAHNADSDEVSRARTLYHFGMMLHAVQDFYSNTNYLMLKVDELHRTARDGFDPYSIDLFDWSKLSHHKQTIVAGGELKLEANKETRRLRGRLPLADSTYLKVERGLAIRETMRQWTYLETLLKNRYGERADTILIALKQASCSIKVPPDAEDEI